MPSNTETSVADKPPQSGQAETVWHSFGYAWQGMRYVIRTQRNAKIHLVITVMVLALALWLGVSASEWAILSLTVAVVLAAEMMNTSLEALVDLVSPEFHPLAKIAKDTAAGAVFTLALGAVLVGVFILGPPLLVWIGESLLPKIFAWL